MCDHLESPRQWNNKDLTKITAAASTRPSTRGYMTHRDTHIEAVPLQMHISQTAHESGRNTDWVGWLQPVHCPGQTDRQATLPWCIVHLCCNICSPLEITDEYEPGLCFFSRHPPVTDVIRSKNQLRLHKKAVSCLWVSLYSSPSGSRTADPQV